MLFRKFSFYLAVVGIVACAMIVRRLQKLPPAPPPVSEPARSPYADTVAATGLIEAARENVKIAAPKPGLVTRVMVAVGDAVKAGDPLFQLDDREVRARIATLEKQVTALEVSLKPREVMVADWTDRLARTSRLEREKVATEDERKRTEYTLEGAKAEIETIRAQVEAQRQQWAQAKVELDVLTVRAPRDGRLLTVNVRAGEFAPAAVMPEPLMILGDVEKLQVRAEVDEQNAPMVEVNRAATAYLKGDRDQPIPLRFVRIEPYVVPKRSLTGDSQERVDTRVLQVIFEFERPKFPVYVGQQVDVFIERGK
jgi:HlyD family secretion protein